MPSKLLTVRVSDDLSNAIAQLMAETGLDKTAVVHKLLKIGLEVGIENQPVIQNGTTSRLAENTLNPDIEQIIDNCITKRLTELENRITDRVTERSKRITEQMGE
jgi:antitoxin component of RelBE/YafQ-DinJ toxin-antitoxin module